MYHYITLTASKLRRLSAARCNSQQNVIAYSHHITVQGGVLNWALLAELLTRLKRLDYLRCTNLEDMRSLYSRTFRWNTWEEPFPPNVGQCLAEFWPNAVLHVENLPVGYESEVLGIQKLDCELLDQLPGSRNIRAITADVKYEHPSLVRCLKQALLRCENLETLHLRTPRLKGQYDPESNGPSGAVFDLDIQLEESLAPLRELIFETRLLLQPRNTPTNRNRFWNFSNLRHLELRGTSMMQFIESTKGQIKHLQVLKLQNIGWPGKYSWEDGSEMMNEFICNISGLRELEVVEAGFQLWYTTVLAQGKTLEKLVYYTPRRCRRPGLGYARARSYESENLSILATACLELRTITLHMETVTDDLVCSRSNSKQSSSIILCC